MSDEFTTIKTDQGDVKIPHNDKELQKVVALIYSMDIQLEKAIKALEFYASTEAYEQIKDVHADWRYALIEEDEYYTKSKEHFTICKAGKFAMETLKEIRGEE